MAQRTEDLDEIPSVNLDDRPSIALDSSKEKKIEAAPVVAVNPPAVPSKINNA